MAEATLGQRQSELSLAEKTWQRSQKLAAERAISAQQLDNDQTRFLNAQAMLQVAKAQINAIKAGVQAAEAEVAQDQANIHAAQADSDNLSSEPEELVVQGRRPDPVQS